MTTATTAAAQGGGKAAAGKGSGVAVDGEKGNVGGEAGAVVRRPRRDAARNHQLVLDAARELLGERGLDASMEQIAARAGVGVGTVYRRFPSKDSLVEELVTLVSEELVELGEQALDGDDGTGLEYYVRVICQSFADHRRWAGLLLPQASRTQYAGEVVRELLVKFLDNAQRDGTISAEVTPGDVMAMLWSMRGLIEAVGDMAPECWKRYLDIHLSGMRSAGPLSQNPAITTEQLRGLPANRFGSQA
ncbi:MAG TPA: helix-turn-helix domain-containing protein [Actinocrinis sp.]|nr:helix-turn-helix domain-containing protein [Actinocrinis sp.]